jgi:hypothetical protein
MPKKTVFLGKARFAEKKIALKDCARGLLPEGDEL